jgi:hypothetical protein
LRLRVNRERADDRRRCEGGEEDAPSDPAVQLGHESGGQRVREQRLDDADRELERGLLGRDIMRYRDGAMGRETDLPASLGVLRPHPPNGDADRVAVWMPLLAG